MINTINAMKIATHSTRKSLIALSPAILKNITLSFMRRATMTQNILDFMTTKSFRANYKAEQDTEYKILKDDMSRLTNRGSKYSKQQKRDQKQLDKMSDKIAKTHFDIAKA